MKILAMSLKSLHLPLLMMMTCLPMRALEQLSKLKQILELKHKRFNQGSKS